MSVMTMVTRYIFLSALVLQLAGCVSVPAPAPAETDATAVKTQPAAAPAETTGATVIARNERFAAILPKRDDTLASVARDFLGDAGRAWEIAQFNQVTEITAGHALVVPLRPVNPLGISANGVQTVPILCYHRVGPRPALMVMPRETFAAQMHYLKHNNYTVIRLGDLPDFLAGKRALPPRAVVITFDDGHASAYHHAFPVLREYGFPATYFLYTDFLGAGSEALNWPQMKEMEKSGLIDFQSHSKTHRNLMLRLPGESDQHYQERVYAEFRTPRDVIERNLRVNVSHYAFPYGDANQTALDSLVRTGHQLGLTVNPGGNAFFAYPLMLRRTMIFGSSSMQSFRAALQVAREIKLQ